MTDDVLKPPHSIHIALIPDGNRRWAEERGLPVWEGHKKGAETLVEFIKWCSEYKQIKAISVFGLSTENVKRPKKEVEELWNVYRESFNRMLQAKVITDNELKVRILGFDGVWRSDVKKAAGSLMDTTAQYSRTVVNILLNYGSQFEIIEAMKKTLKRNITKRQTLKKAFDKYLIISSPVDLIIRTGDQQRLSNFLLYQSAYAEIYFSKTMWPGFKKREFDRIMNWYFEQQRKFGK